MPLWKMPPKTKVHEALSAVADGRARITGSCSAEVVSSSGDKTYAIEWTEDMTKISSNDNASYWQGYIGYPVIAVLLALGKITYQQDVARQLVGIAWKDLNKQFKRDYEKAVQYALEGVATKGGDTQAIDQEVQNIYFQLSQLKLERGPQRKAPPK
ncbi:MAG: hypothetical protein ACREX9_11110 [Gammaproteobacteria bacterium]